MNNKALSQDETQDAKRLRQIWNAKKDEMHLSQVKAAEILGYNSQGAISQYLNGRVAMNLATVAKFAHLLKVRVEDISPRYAKMVGNPTPAPLEAYTPPSCGSVGGIETNDCLNWFAYSKEFAESLGVNPENLKTFRLVDGTFREMPENSILIVDDSTQVKPEDGVYLLELNGVIVARRIAITDDGLLIQGGNKKMTVSKDAYGLLRIVARVISVFTPVK